MHKYNKLHQLLESDVDRVASGEYRADVDDPDFSNPYAAACWYVRWELFPLKTRRVFPN